MEQLPRAAIGLAVGARAPASRTHAARRKAACEPRGRNAEKCLTSPDMS